MQEKHNDSSFTEISDEFTFTADTQFHSVWLYEFTNDLGSNLDVLELDPGKYGLETKEGKYPVLIFDVNKLEFLAISSLLNYRLLVKESIRAIATLKFEEGYPVLVIVSSDAARKVMSFIGKFISQGKGINYTHLEGLEEAKAIAQKLTLGELDASDIKPKMRK